MTTPCDGCGDPDVVLWQKGDRLLCQWCMNQRCRYEDCSGQNPVAADDERVTCPLCREHMGLPSCGEADR